MNPTTTKKEDAGSAAPPTLDRLMQMAWGFAAAEILATALALKLFTRVEQGEATLAALESSTRASRRGLAMVVDALVAFGLLQRKGGGAQAVLSLAPDAALYLVEGKPSYLGDFLRFHVDVVARNWAGLGECVKSGQPRVPLDRPQEGVPFWHQLVDGLFNLNFPGAMNLARTLLRETKTRPLHVLDVACGSGVWGIAQALAEPTTRVTFFDLKETLEHAHRFAEREKIAARATWLEGDLRATDPGAARYDVAILGHICHSEGAARTRELLAKMARALKPGGTLAIAEFVPDDTRSSPPLALVFALNMLVHTSEGDAFTFADYRDWLTHAGFKDVRRLDGPTPFPLILATR